MSAAAPHVPSRPLLPRLPPLIARPLPAGAAELNATLPQYKARPDIAWRTTDLSRFSHRPGPHHFAAAQHLLRYLKGSPDAGLTYHGSDEVLMQSYGHRSKIILATDSGY